MVRVCLVDWSSQNVLAVGLGSCVYLWSACTSKVTKLCDVGLERDSVASVGWTLRGNHLAIGTRTGEVQLWDVVKGKIVRDFQGHVARVGEPIELFLSLPALLVFLKRSSTGTLAWSSHSLATGSRDRTILLRDPRSQESFSSKLVGHKQEVCGLRWAPDERMLASGGNDNKLLVWTPQQTSPVLRFNEHQAAIKAISWSPHQHGLLASGGGTADRCIRFWNTTTGTQLGSYDTGSQVCRLLCVFLAQR